MKYHIGKSIRKAQELKGISNNKMCDDFGVVRQQVHRWQTTEDMSVSKAELFAAYFKMPLNKFLSLGASE